jgi:hypothetical protein
VARVPASSAELRGLVHRRALVFATAAVLLAIAVRIGFVLTTPHYHLVSDPADYQRIAASVAHGHGFGESKVAPGGGPSAFRPPLYPISLGVFYAVVGVHVQAARLAEALLGGLTVGLLGLLALQLGLGRRVAAVAMAIAAVYPPLVITGSALLSETLAVPLELAAVSAALVGRSSPHRLRWAAVTGLLAGLGILDRPNTALLLIPLVLLLGVSWRVAALTVGVALASLLPWLARDAHVFHEPVPLTTQGGLVMSGTYNSVSDHDRTYPAAFRPANFVPEYAAIIRAHPHMGEYEAERRFRAASLRYVRHHPSYPAKVAFWNTVRLFDITGRGFARNAAREIGYTTRVADVGLVTYFVVLLLAMAGAATPVARRVPKVVWLVPLAVVVSTVFLQGETRMRAGVEPFLVLLAAVALVTLTGATRRGTSSS